MQAAVFDGDESSQGHDFLLLDDTSVSMGWETAVGIMTKLIERHSNIPTKDGQTFAMYADDQLDVLMKVFEEVRAMTKVNHLLGKLHPGEHCDDWEDTA